MALTDIIDYLSRAEAPETRDIPLTDPSTIPADEKQLVFPADVSALSRESGLPLAKRYHARTLTVRAAALALHHAPQVHYTQGANRWSGIANHQLARLGAYPRYADCSAFVTWSLWNAHAYYGKKWEGRQRKWSELGGWLHRHAP
jgi:hypothetical protein